MIKISYKLELLSSLIVSPRSTQALYTGIDEFCRIPKTELPIWKNKEEQETKVVYPFSQYGEYTRYDPEHTEYYLPGSSIKGGLIAAQKREYCLMADDITVPNSKIVLRNLWKAQYLQNLKKAEFAIFFNNVGVEMIKAHTNLYGDLYVETVSDFLDVLAEASKYTIQKMDQMHRYLQELWKKGYQNQELLECFERIHTNLDLLLKEKNILILGGYKGLLHSILLDQNAKEFSGGVFIDFETFLPHGIVKIEQNI